MVLISIVARKEEADKNIPFHLENEYSESCCLSLSNRRCKEGKK